MSRPIWLHHPASLAHDIPGHPERPARLLGLEAAMEAHDWFGWERILSPEATREQLLRVHPEAHVDFIESLCAAGGGAIDGDTACIPETWEAALRGAGGAVALVDALLSDAAPTGFSAHRPPGHHAEPARAMGFCFLANAAIAAEHARAAGVERVLIVDWDVHHGNGTEACFADRDDVLFVSIHQSPLYPGTGPASFAGVGAGEGYTVNLPVPPGSGDSAFVSHVEHVVLPLAEAYKPGLILVSAGFDAHEKDPLASCRVTEEGFRRMTELLFAAGGRAGAPVGFLLEGGYSVEALADSVCAMAPAFTEDAIAASSVPVNPLSVEAIGRLRRWWPALPAPTA